jgi:hypothetical protein
MECPMMSQWWQLACLSALLLFPGLKDAEALSYYSCDIGQEKLVKVHRSLKTAHTDLRAAQREEELIRAELWTCLPGGIKSLARTRRCGHARHDLPATMKQTIDATYRVQEIQKVVQDRHAWQMKICGRTP